LKKKNGETCANNFGRRGNSKPKHDPVRNPRSLGGTPRFTVGKKPSAGKVEEREMENEKRRG